MSFRYLAAGVFFGLTASIASAQEVLSRQLPASEFEFIETRWSDGTISQIVGWKPIAVDGRVEICGATIIPNPTYRRDTRRALERAKIYINDQLVLEDLSYWEQPRGVRNPENAIGNCKATNFPASEVREGSFRIDYTARARG